MHFSIFCKHLKTLFLNDIFRQIKSAIKGFYLIYVGDFSFKNIAEVRITKVRGFFAQLFINSKKTGRNLDTFSSATMQNQRAKSTTQFVQRRTKLNGGLLFSAVFKNMFKSANHKSILFKRANQNACSDHV